MSKNALRIIGNFILLGIIINCSFQLINFPIKDSGLSEIQDKKYRIPKLSFNTTWTENGIPICTKPDFQTRCQITSDGSNGIILIWHDSRNGYGTDDIYGQRIDIGGNIHWNFDGKLIIDANESQRYPRICRSEDGGIIITWIDKRNEENINSNIDIYVQKIDVNGDIQWGLEDVPICTVKGHQWYPEICSDGSGGAIITWDDDRTENGLYGIYAQRINSRGEIQWRANGTAICTGKWRYLKPKIRSDGDGGAIIVWGDERQRINERELYAQRINSTGDTLWLVNGTRISHYVSDKRTFDICNDDNFGTIISWRDEKSEDEIRLCAQKIDFDGNLLWGDNGSIIREDDSGLVIPRICSDGDGGAIMVWQDNGIHIQRISSTGTRLWEENGVFVFSGNEPNIISDKHGGAIIGFVRGDISYRDVYIQHFNDKGNRTWTDTAFPLCMAEYRQYTPVMYCDDIGNAFFAWEDNRVDANRNRDIFAQLITYEVPLNPDQAISFSYFFFLVGCIAFISLAMIPTLQILKR